ncbi:MULTISPECIES: MFS transporter [Brevibacillus]|uniref:MFS transporter n=1 Tax=Brevibacillus TaxID=55080 RepID=UPI000D10D894|nr:MULTISPECIES: MFS transporter [Brevibacillus]PSJ67906.1 MFS sugar transporter [Brevibacillus brevis]RED35364.1 multidrug resistance protein [Brevibacillus brevis]TQK63688.1 multidrug resistance protein [Brevibacillus sp. AG162]VEF89525.1 Inner membrane transport protein ydhP [Brevibacillus brevis]GEC87970.1 chloramphenicol resistance protein [Brevibacillus brevis]
MSTITSNVKQQATGTKNSTLALLALAISAFGIGTTEFVIVGLLSTVAQDLKVTITLAGLLISGYALGVAIGAPIITALTSRIPRKMLLMLLMIVFVVGNSAAALSSSFTLLIIARFFTAFSHGVFFSIGSTIAADLVPENKRASAIATMFTGLTVATVTGVPLGTFIGQMFGWRATFWGVAILGVIALISTAILVPSHLKKSKPASIKDQVKIITNLPLLLVFGITALGYGGTFVTFTFLGPILEEITGYQASAVSLILLVYGIAVAIGNTVGGKAADKNPIKALRWMFIIQAIILIILTFTAPFKWVGTLTIILMGLLAFMNVPGLQVYVVQLAEKYVPSAVDVASAINIAAFNLGIAIGAFVGGIIVDTIGLIHTPWVGGVMVLGAALLTAISSKLEKTRR